MSTIYCRPYDIRVSDTLPDGTPHTNIRFWCLDRDSSPVLVRVEDFTSFIRVELPSFFEGKSFKWDSERADMVSQWLTVALKNHAPTLSLFCKRTSLYYYQNKKPFLVLFFESNEAQRHCVNFLRREKRVPGLGLMQLSAWEQDISAVRKMLTLNKQAYTQWISFEAENIEPEDNDRISKSGSPSRPQQEYRISWKEMNPVPLAESKTWIINPRALSYDFETYSDNHKTFPDAYNPRHAIFNVSLVGMDGKDEESKMRYSILFGRSPPPDNAIHIETKTEPELLARFEDCISDYDPEILIGYNNFGFDNEYFTVRNKIHARTIGNFSRLKEGVVTSETRKWKSAGFGHNVITTFDAEGRVSIDMLTIIKREFKMSMYTLSYVSKELLDQDKHDVTPKEMFVAYEENRKGCEKLKQNPDSPYGHRKINGMQRVLNYCLQDSELPLKLYHKLETFISLIEMSSVVGVTPTELFTRGQQVRTYSYLFDLAYNNGVVITKRTDVPILPFSGAFVMDPVIGVHDDVQAQDFTGLYPSIMMAENLCYTTLVRPEDVEFIDKSKCHYISFFQKDILGKKIEEELEENDFGQTGEGGEESDDENEGSENDNDNYLNIDNLDEDDEPLDPKETYTRYGHYWVNAEHRKGLMPLMMEKLKEERDQVKADLAEVEKAIETCTDRAELLLLFTQRIILDKRQLAIKVTANSGYGFLGAQTAGILPLIEAAMTVTHLGKRYIRRCVNYLIRTYDAKIIYGDTDSVMYKIPGVHGAACVEMGKRIAGELSALFPPPMKVEFEKAMRMILFAKKRYAAYLYKPDGSYMIDKKTGLIYILVRGIVIARRDNCKWLRDLYISILRSILDRMPINLTYRILVDGALKLLTDKVDPIKELSVTKTLNAQYKSSTCQMKIFGDHLTAIGKPAKPGERLSYLVLKDEDDGTQYQKRLGEKMTLSEDFDPDENEIDDVYYMDRLLRKPIDQLFSVGYLDEIHKYEDFRYLPIHFSGQKRSKSIETPVEMISLMMQDAAKGGIKKSRLVRSVARLPDLFDEFYADLA